MKRIWIGVLLMLALPFGGACQDLHFSQYYNAPMLLNPANTALTPDHDDRVGANYRNQWASVPAPYSTFSAYADFKAVRSEYSSNWLGVGLAFFSDKAGDGNLSLGRYEGFLAYHLQLSQVSLLSGGLSAAFVQRSVDFSKVTFDSQWDGFSFNPDLDNTEKPGQVKTGFLDVGAGLNLAYFPSESLYFQIGAGVAHINQPVESFYGGSNRVVMRPSATLELLAQINPRFIINPSVYYSMQGTARQIVAGSLFNFYMNGPEGNANQFVIGAYARIGDAVIPTVGFDLGKFRIMTSYDITTSNFSAVNQGRGALEFSVRYIGDYSNAGARNLYNCPRF